MKFNVQFYYIFPSSFSVGFLIFMSGWGKNSKREKVLAKFPSKLISPSGSVVAGHMVLSLVLCLYLYIYTVRTRAFDLVNERFITSSHSSAPHALDFSNSFELLVLLGLALNFILSNLCSSHHRIEYRIQICL